VAVSLIATKTSSSNAGARDVGTRLRSTGRSVPLGTREGRPLYEPTSPMCAPQASMAPLLAHGNSERRSSLHGAYAGCRLVRRKTSTGKIKFSWLSSCRSPRIQEGMQQLMDELLHTFLYTGRRLPTRSTTRGMRRNWQRPSANTLARRRGPEPQESAAQSRPPLCSHCRSAPQLPTAPQHAHHAREPGSVRGESGGQEQALAKSISEEGWGEFVRQLGYKAKWYVGTLVKIDQWYPSSKTCSACGHSLDSLDLSIRSWVYPAKGMNACMKDVLPRPMGTSGQAVL
jgi:hypothetical protein